MRYLPHHPVIRQDKNTTEMHIVYDASSSVNSVSLNSCLEPGPCLIPNLLDVLIRFRYHKIGLVSDIEKAFLQISMRESDRDVLRFLWIDPIKKKNPEIVMMRFARVLFGVNCSPFQLGGTVEHHLKEFEAIDPEFVVKFLESLYADDSVNGADTLEASFELYLKSRGIMDAGGFKLRKWRSNSEELIKLINDNEGDSVKDQSISGDLVADDESFADIMLASREVAKEKDEEKVLGLIWNTSTDSFVFRLDRLVDLARSLKPTKRDLLKILAKLFDPMELLSPIIIPMKYLFQELCTSKLGWDEPLSELFQRRWGDWLSELEATRSITIPRCYKLNTSDKILSTELHGFSDASIKAFAAVTYMRFKTEFGCLASLVTSKTRVAPAKKQSLPRLELLGILILAQLIVRTALQHVVQFNHLTCWSDSLVALYWIIHDKEWKQFVKNRANEVRSLISPDSLRFCLGTDNPADIPTQGIAASGLENNELWWNGPKWLKTSEENWLENAYLQKVPPEAMEELKSSDFTVINLSVTSDVKLETLIDSHRFSSFDKLLRITAWVKRFVYKCRSSKLKKSGNLTAEEIVDTEEVWIQQRFSSVQLKQLEHSLGLFVDTKGIIRSRGRIAISCTVILKPPCNKTDSQKLPC